MSFKDTLQKSLTPELLEQVVDALGDDFNYDLVPRTRLNKVIKQRDEAKAALGGKQPPKTRTKSKAGTEEDDDDDDEGIDVEALKEQYQKDADNRVKAVQIQFAALEKLRAANAIDPELLWSSNVFDKSKLDINEKGELVGFDDMLTEVKKSRAQQFKQKDDGVPNGTGKNGGNEFEGVTTKEKFLELSADKQIAFKNANPELFKQFLSAV